ncbi:MAG TPA: Uma2 family endonuclease [Jatrophihabitans sp.]|uniref:Uma2 family endonuclease n=1 Tax=Jatrophihabitans sp. TaxID=1932789 RepID=UPI002E0C2BE4|nr:Uma2 family endonuclease [Jatrophihabitans sp.]
MEEFTMHPLVEMRDVWTLDDLDTLDVEDRHRYEIVDGALVVSPTPGLRHEFAIGFLARMLTRAAPEDLIVLAGNAGISIGASYRVADLLVVPDDARSRTARALEPREVWLAVEVVSTGSVTTDRITKPAQYAAAGIPNFWRVETDPLGITACRLDAGAGVYTEIGSWAPGETARIAEPFPVEIEVDRLG